MDSEQGGVQLRGQQVLALARPDRLRVEILGFLSQTQAVLVTDGGRYQLLVVGDRSYRAGLLYPGLLWEVARIDLEPVEVVELVLGAPLPDRRLELARALQGADGMLRLELASPALDEREVLAFDAAGRLRSLSRYRGAERLYQARFDDYAPVSGVPLAHSIALDFERSGTRARLSLRDLELNPGLPDALFRLDPPRAGSGGPGG